MNVLEFETFALTVPLCNDIFVQRDAAACFGLSMMTQVNDLDFERHLQGQFIEFLEAFCRACEMCAYAPMQTMNPSNLFEEVYMSVEDRKAQPLHVKIENVMPLVLKNAAKRTFVER